MSNENEPVASASDNGPGPSQLPEHRLDRRMVLVVGCISAVAALSGALAGGCASYKAAEVAAVSDRQKELDNFRREQQVAAYTDFDAKFQDFISSAVYYQSNVLNSGYPDAPQYGPPKPADDFNAAYFKFSAASTKVSFSGTPDAMKLAGEVLDKVNAVRGHITNWDSILAYHRDPPPTEEQRKDFSDKLTDLSNDASAKEAEFVHEARVDLGIA